MYSSIGSRLVVCGFVCVRACVHVCEVSIVHAAFYSLLVANSCFRNPLDFPVVVWVSCLYFSIQLLAYENPRIVTHSFTIISSRTLPISSSHSVQTMLQKNWTLSLFSRICLLSAPIVVEYVVN